MTKTYKSEALAAVHEMMEGFYESGAIGKKTMREFDEGCLTTVEPLTPEEVRTIRERESISQPVFARYLNVSKGTGFRLGARCQKPEWPRASLVDRGSE